MNGHCGLGACVFVVVMLSLADTLADISHSEQQPQKVCGAFDSLMAYLASLELLSAMTGPRRVSRHGEISVIEKPFGRQDEPGRTT